MTDHAWPRSRQQPRHTTRHDHNCMPYPLSWLSNPRRVARQCQLTLALPLQGLLVISGGYPCTGWEPTGFCKPPTRTCENPHPWTRVRVLMGTGVGYPGKPQGSPWHSLTRGLWVMGYGMHFPAHQVGGQLELWDIRGYGLSGLWVMTGPTVTTYNLFYYIVY